MTSEPTETSTPAPTTTSTTARDVTSYDSLTDRGKELFQTVLVDGPIEREKNAVPERLWEAESVRYEGSVYTLSKSRV